MTGRSTAVADPMTGLRKARRVSLFAAPSEEEKGDRPGADGAPEGHRADLSAALSAALAVWLAEGRDLAARVRRGEPFRVPSAEQDSFDELVELVQVLDRAAYDDARRAA